MIWSGTRAYLLLRERRSDRFDSNLRRVRNRPGMTLWTFLSFKNLNTRSWWLCSSRSSRFNGAWFALGCEHKIYLDAVPLLLPFLPFILNIIKKKNLYQGTWTLLPSEIFWHLSHECVSTKANTSLIYDLWRGEVEISYSNLSNLSDSSCSLV
jgi:hypothetical protein